MKLTLLAAFFVFVKSLIAADEANGPEAEQYSSVRTSGEGATALTAVPAIPDGETVRGNLSSESSDDRALSISPHVIEAELPAAALPHPDRVHDVELQTPTTDLTVGTAPGVANFRGFPAIVPDGIQEILVPSSVTPRAPGSTTTIVADFDSTKGLPLKQAESGSVDTKQQQRRDPTAEKLERPSSNAELLCAVFEGPGHFAFSGDTCPGLANDRPVMIYEGMTVTSDATGRYEVRFLVDAPDSNMILRLQLQLQFQGQPIGSITIPPIELASSHSDSDQEDHSVPAGGTRTWLVRRTGFSSVLAKFPDSARQDISMTRTATVRIGTTPDSYTAQ